MSDEGKSDQGEIKRLPIPLPPEGAITNFVRADRGTVALAEIQPEPGVEPFPDPNDRVRIAIYDTLTGDIRQIVSCALQDMHRQHDAWPGCDYIEVPLEVEPRSHKIDTKTMTAAERTEPTAADLSLKEQELWIAARDAAAVVRSGATGSPLEYASPDMASLALACMVGGEIQTKDGPVFHTEEQAKALARDMATARSADAAKLADLQAAIPAAKSRGELDAIKW